MKTIVLIWIGAFEVSNAINTPDGYPVYPLEYHWNEDPHSVPSPIAGKPYMTSTQAKLEKNGQYQEAREPTSVLDPHNPYATEPFYKKETVDRQGWAVPFSSVNYLQWTVKPDLGEKDNQVLEREADGDYETGGAKKKSGWTNPLGWTDSGHDDDLILFQIKADGSFKKHVFQGMNA